LVGGHRRLIYQTQGERSNQQNNHCKKVGCLPGIIPVPIPVNDPGPIHGK
jgi:hypothetical protein